MFWIYDLPNWLFGIVSIIAFTLFGLTGLLTTRKLVRRVHREDYSHNDVVGYYLAAVTVFYGVTLGLVAVGTWTNFEAVQDKVDREAQSVASLYRDAGSLPGPTRTLLQADLRNYTVEVIDHSWPEQRKGIIPRGSQPMVDRFQDDLTAFRPQNAGEQVLYAETFRQFNDLVESRRARLDAVNTGIPASLWWLVIMGALISIAATLFFDMRSLPMHTAMTILVGALLGLMIFLVATLDQPFRGKVSVGPVALQRVYDQLMRSH